MPDIQKMGVILLLKSALLEKPLSLLEEFEISTAIEIAMKHDIANLIYSGAVLCGVSTENPELRDLFILSCARVIFNEQQMKSLKEIYYEFEKNGIDYLPLKGSVIKELYPKAEMRSMGDADILIKMEQYDEVKKIMFALGYLEGIESDHELKWKNKFIALELHKHLISPNHKDYFEYWKSPWKNAIKLPESKHRFGFSDEDTLIYMITHLAIHYRSGGIGIKHIIDIWVYLTKKTKLKYKLY